jgi:acyl dehydratase
MLPTMSTRLEGIEGIRRRVGTELGATGWHPVTQGDIDAFADCTGDHQWIHVDADRARESPFGTTIAHGLYTLSLGPRLNDELFEITGFDYGLNYGFERVRFPAPAPVGCRLRMRADLVEAEPVPGGIQIVVRQTFEREGEAKPVCVADAVSRWILAAEPTSAVVGEVDDVALVGGEDALGGIRGIGLP